MTERLAPDICVIGAGSAGLTVAAGAARLGVPTVLIEPGPMGGDCLNYGCVPSKALLAAAAAAEAIRGASRFGVSAGPPAIDFARVRTHLQQVIAAIAPHDSVERFEGLGVRVIRAAARFVARDAVEAGGLRIHARRFVIAAGSRAAVPPIPGLDRVPFLTNETVFELAERPQRLLVVGGGPIGCELAQAFRRLGSAVTLLEAQSLLPKDDPEAVAVLRKRLQAEGVELREGVTVTGVAAADRRMAVAFEGAAGAARVEGDALLVATGRRPSIEGLGLETAGVAHSARGIAVDERCRTSNRRIYAIGDVTGGLQFTHMAGHEAGIVLRNALFRLPARRERRAIPWVTYTDPELAQVGMTEAAARAAGQEPRIVRVPYADLDRARTARASEGFAKLITTRRGRVLGATIVGAEAGELILPWTLAVAGKLRLRDLAGMIAPYPTLGEMAKKAAGAFYAPALFSGRTRALVRLLRLLG